MPRTYFNIVSRGQTPLPFLLFPVAGRESGVSLNINSCIAAEILRTNQITVSIVTFHLAHVFVTVMEDLREMCLCCGNTTSLRDRRVLESPNACEIVPTLFEILHKAMIHSGKEYETDILNSTACKYICRKCYGLLQRRMKIDNLLLNQAKKVIDFALANMATTSTTPPRSIAGVKRQLSYGEIPPAKVSNIPKRVAQSLHKTPKISKEPDLFVRY